jgi:hypothetical protein
MQGNRLIDFYPEGCSVFATWLPPPRGLTTKTVDHNSRLLGNIMEFFKKYGNVVNVIFVVFEKTRTRVRYIFSLYYYKRFLNNGYVEYGS